MRRGVRFRRARAARRCIAAATAPGWLEESPADRTSTGKAMAEPMSASRRQRWRDTLDRMELRRIEETLWEIPRVGQMRVPARIFADEELLGAIRDDHSLEQLVNVATLPGIVDASLAM